MRTLVAGGAGFPGAHLTAALHRQGHRVVVADNFLTSPAARRTSSRDLVKKPFDLLKSWDPVRKVKMLGGKGARREAYSWVR